MYDFKITKTDFMINGKKELLLCGELHYFRMEKQYWEKALDALVDLSLIHISEPTRRS